ncbi:hypothetical protein [Burkholderia ambifaria]|uniref:hypothetical protein n=1 Tax=Burkholderia ambifaria TaxID=152480 RepID=UPI002011E922|nr:hypothetical protein [Burkholderia ambifaria]
MPIPKWRAKKRTSMPTPVLRLRIHLRTSSHLTFAACGLRNFARRVASLALRNAVAHKLVLAFLDIAPREWDAGTVPHRHRAMLLATEIVMSLKEFAMNNLGIRPGLVQSRVAEFEKGTKNGATDGAQKQAPARSKGQLDGLSSFKGADGASSPPPAAPRTFANLPGRAGNVGAQFLSSALHAGSHFLPPGLASTAMHAAGDMMRPSALGAGDPVTQMAAMQNDFMKQQSEMTRLNNANTMAAAVNQQSQELTSALASVGNKGASNISNAAKGQ